MKNDNEASVPEFSSWTLYPLSLNLALKFIYPPNTKLLWEQECEREKISNGLNG